MFIGRSTAAISVSRSISTDLAIFDQIESIERFKQRLTLPDHIKFSCNSIIQNYNDKAKNRFNSLKFHTGSPTLELYSHIPLDTKIDYDEYQATIIKDLFNRGNVSVQDIFGNDTKKIILTNNPRHPITLESDFTSRSKLVMIFNVLYSKDQISRYRSQYYSPEYNSDYVIWPFKDLCYAMIYPLYLMEYTINFEPLLKEKIDEEFRECKTTRYDHNRIHSFLRKHNISDSDIEEVIYKQMQNRFDSYDERDVTL